MLPLRCVALFALTTLALCGKVDTVSEATAPSVDVADTTPPPQPVVEDAGSGDVSGADVLTDAWKRLEAAMTSLHMQDPSKLLAYAMQLREGSSSRGKRPKSALPMLQAIADAASHPSVPRSNSTVASRELGHMQLRGEGVAAHVDKAIAHYRRAADEGDSEAQHALGVLFSTGFGTARDAPLAATYLYFAAEAGNVAAQLALGYRHLLGVSAPKECKKSLLYYTPVAEKVVAAAQGHKGGGTIEKVRLSVDNPTGVTKLRSDDDVLHYYEASALKGSVDAQLTLGNLHFHGARGLPADMSKAFGYYAKAAAAGDPSAFSQLGDMYAQGIAVEQNNLTALEYFRQGAAKDHPPSQNGLGYMFMHGYGVAKDYKKALEYFKAAAERGNADAQFNLGAMYIGGKGVKLSYERALHFFTLSAHQGHTLATYNLAQLHLNGLGTPRSCTVGAQFLKIVAERGPWGQQFEEAHASLQADTSASAPLHLYLVLAEAGFEVAQANLAFLLDQHYMHTFPSTPLLGMRGDDLAQRAMTMYRLAAMQGNIDAELKLGDYHYYGYGIPVDLEAAVAHYRTASDSRSPQGMFNLAYMYAHGLGLARDYHLAKRHFDMAIETSADAWAPTQLALIELHLLQVWEARTGGALGDPYQYFGSWITPLVEVTAVIEWDTALILVLCAVLGVVVLLRQRQTLPTA